MTLSTGQQIITIHTLRNISKSKSTQTVRLGQLTEYKVRNIFSQISCQKWDSENSSRPLLKTSSWHLSFNVFWWTSTLNKNKFKTF